MPDAGVARLAAAYGSLTDGERRFCRMLAVISVPVAATNLAKCLNAAGIECPGGKQWKRQDAMSVLESESMAPLIRVIVQGAATECFCLEPSLSGLLWGEAVKAGEFPSFNAAVDRAIDLNRIAMRDWRFSTKAAFVRAVRVAVTEGATERLAVIMEKGRRSEWMWNGDDVDEAVAEALISFSSPRQLADMSPEMANAVFPMLLGMTMADARSYQFISRALFDYPGDGLPLFELLRTERLIMHGRMDEAEARLAAIDDPQAFSLRAFIALSRRGDEEEALSLYEDGMKKMTSKPKAYVSWTGFFYPILLHKLNPVNGARRMKGYVNTIDLWGITEDFIPLEAPLRRLLKIERADGEEDEEVSFEEYGLAGFFYLILMYWLGEGGAKLEKKAAGLAERLDSLGLTFLGAELRAAWGKNENGVPHPLAGILPREEEWERSLSALTEIGGCASPSDGGAARVVWKLDWRAYDDGGVVVTELTPVAQVMQKSGWSRGRNIALSRFAKGDASVRGMTEQDVRAAMALRKEYDYYGVNYVFDIPQALTALAGHPFIFRGDSGELVEVSVSDPVISTRRSGRNYVLEMSPFPDEGGGYSVTLDGPNHLRVTRFEKQHLRVARLLGPSGLKVPSRAEEALVKAVESLASVATVQSGLTGVGSAVEEMEAGVRLYVQIQPDGPGLGVEAVVRPFGAGSVPCRPGEGGATLIGLKDGKRVRVVRDLKAEAAAFLSLQTKCPALSEGEAVGDGWRLPEPELALEFLSQLGEMGDEVVAEWPRGQSMKLTFPSVGEGSFTAAIRQAQDWFALSGELRVDEDTVMSMKTLLDNINGQYGRFVPLGNGEFLALTKEFRRRLKALSDLGDERGGEVRLPVMAAAVADELLDGTASLDAPPDWKKRMSLINEAGRLDPALPSVFKGELRGYQEEGFRWLMRLAHWGAGACLADDMGLGKTVQVLAVLAARGGEGPSLVVAPTSVCSNWVSEAAKFVPALNVTELRHAGRDELLAGLGAMDVVVASYGILQNEMERLSGISWNVIALDESQAIKNMGTKRSSAVMKLSGAFRIATTGTPVENRLSELWNLFRFLNPGYLGSLDSFWRRFGSPIEKDGDAEARERLRRMIRPFILRRTKQQVLSELPGKTEITLKVDLKDGERAFYEALRRGAVEELSGVSRDSAGQGRFQVLAALMKLRRACCCSSLVNADMDLPSAKLEAFADVLAELRAGGHRALVFSQFVDHLSVIRGWLDREKVPYQYLDGSTPPDERARRVAAFQSGEGDCFLISLRAGGTGLNLTAADYVIHMDPWWNPAVEAQASDRAHRIGQERPVTVYRIVARDTIEEKIVSLHEWKRGLADGLLADSDSAVTLSVDELLNLIKE